MQHIYCRLYHLFCCITIALSACGQVRKSDDKISGIIIERNFPQMSWDSVENELKLVRYDPYFTRIYTFNGWTLIQSNYYYQRIRLVDGERIFKPGEDTSVHSCFYSFVYHDSLPAAFYCDSTEYQTGRLINKDSMLKKEWLLSRKETLYFEDNTWKLLSAKNNEEGDLTEFYFLVSKTDSGIKGNLEITFSTNKCQETHFSLAATVEARRKMKVIALIINTGPLIISAGKTRIGPIELFEKMKELPVAGDKSIEQIFKYAQNRITGNKPEKDKQPDTGIQY